MKKIFDDVSLLASKITTRKYSTSFSLGIYCLNKKLHNDIYSIYGFVRFADEIVDSFHGFDKETLLNEFERDVYLAIDRKISLNPILNSFQEVVNKFNIDHELIACFLKSMRMDLDKNIHSQNSYEDYILGSAEVVGLMCLRVFTNGDDATYEKLKPSAMKLGAAFQKVNFLRDLKADYQDLGRVYFPSVDMRCFNKHIKEQLELEIEGDFNDALVGIKQLDSKSRFGVYVAYIYYRQLFKKIKSTDAKEIMTSRIRVSNPQKLSLLFSSYIRHSFRMI